MKDLTLLESAILEEYAAPTSFCEDDVYDILTIHGADCALSFLTEYVLVPPRTESQRFLNVISRFKQEELVGAIQRIAVKADGADEVSRQMEEYARRKIKSWKKLVGTERDISFYIGICNMTLKELIEHPNGDLFAQSCYAEYCSSKDYSQIFFNPCLWLLNSQLQNLRILGHEFAHVIGYRSQGEADSIGKDLALYEFRLGNTGIQLSLFAEGRQISELEQWVKNNG